MSIKWLPKYLQGLCPVNIQIFIDIYFYLVYNVYNIKNFVFMNKMIFYNCLKRKGEKLV